jgi:hypothetical protein
MLPLHSLEALEIRDKTGHIFLGCNQDWFVNAGFVRHAACGAAVCSTIFGYLLRTRTEWQGNCVRPAELESKDAILSFMETVYTHVRPRKGGVMGDHFAEGSATLAKSLQIPLMPEMLKIPVRKSLRPRIDDMRDFLTASISADIPAAFLILSNGRSENLDTWHWVTVTAVDAGETGIGMRAQILDNGALFWTDLGLWLQTSLIGGAFVRFCHSSEEIV